MKVIPCGGVAPARAPEGVRDQSAHQRLVHGDVLQKTAVLKRDVALPDDRLSKEQVANRGELWHRRGLSDGEIAAHDLLSHIRRNGVVSGKTTSKLHQR